MGLFAHDDKYLSVNFLQPELINKVALISVGYRANIERRVNLFKQMRQMQAR